MTRKQAIAEALTAIVGLPAFIFALAMLGHAFGY